MRTMAQLAEEAMQVQDACNLSGVVKGMDRAIASLRELGVTGTDQIREHFVTRLWAAKVADLCGFYSFSENPFSDAWMKCQAVVEESRMSHMALEK